MIRQKVIPSPMLSDKTVYSLHRISGLIGGFFILILTITGSILVVDNQVDAIINPPKQQVEAVGPRHSYDQLITTLQKQYPTAKLRSLRLPASDAPEPVQVDLMEGRARKRMDINPYTGSIIGEQNIDAAFVRRIHELHENLLLEPVGGYIMGLAGICLLASVVTGTWYYRRSLLSVFKIGVRWNKSPRIVYADLHKWLGVVALLFMLLMSATGIFFHWEQIERAFGDGERRERPQSAQIQPTTFAVDAAITKAKTSFADFRPQLIQFPDPGDTVLTIRGNFPNSLRILGKYNVEAKVDVRTGTIVSSFNARDAGLEYKAEHIFEELHFGRYGGWVSQIIYILLALSTAVVTVSGLALWLLKRG